MAAAVDNFVDWLGNKLKELNTDESVFGSYITGILDCDDSIEEKTEALQGILSEIIENEGDVITQLCDEILEMYVKLQPRQSNASNSVIEDVDVKLAKMLESQCLATTKQKEYTADEKKIREAILSQYSQMTDDEEDEVEVNPSAGDHHKDTALEKNLNAHSVHQAERERREQSRLDSQKKKEKDREDREKQKQMKEDKKEKRKTQKGERRR